MFFMHRVFYWFHKFVWNEMLYFESVKMKWSQDYFDNLLYHFSLLYVTFTQGRSSLPLGHSFICKIIYVLYVCLSSCRKSLWQENYTSQIIFTNWCQFLRFCWFQIYICRSAYSAFMFCVYHLGFYSLCSYKCFGSPRLSCQLDMV